MSNSNLSNKKNPNGIWHITSGLIYILFGIYFGYMQLSGARKFGFSSNTVIIFIVFCALYGGFRLYRGWAIYNNK